MPAYDAILFDFDGVLLDSEPLHCACWAEVLAPFGVNLTWEEYGPRYAGLDDRIMLQIIASEARPPLAWETLWEQYPAKKELFRLRMKNPEFPPKLPLLLERLHTQYKLAVVSSSARIEIEPPLELRNLRRYFGTLVGGGDVERHKPAPDPYLLAARLLGAQAPLVIEDSPSGIASGRAAGFPVLEVKRAAEMPDILLTYLYG
ncbi:MAG TPA: HAD family phosphatase [Bryobacteraceae bacterium]|nr:HAD family phosphatase [Bryobacteraceae bacterium]